MKVSAGKVGEAKAAEAQEAGEVLPTLLSSGCGMGFQSK
jgi:hypothetical protein